MNNNDIYQIQSKLLKYSLFGNVPPTEPLRGVLLKGVVGKFNIFTGYLYADGKFEGRYLLTYFIKRAFEISRTSEGYEFPHYNDMITELEDLASDELQLAIDEVRTIYDYIQNKLNLERTRLKRVLPSSETCNEKFHRPNIISGYTVPKSTGNYGSHHDRILFRDIPSEDIFIHPKYIAGFQDAEYEFIVINRTNEGLIKFTDADNVLITAK